MEIYVQFLDLVYFLFPWLKSGFNVVIEIYSSHILLRNKDPIYDVFLNHVGGRNSLCSFLSIAICLFICFMVEDPSQQFSFVSRWGQCLLGIISLCFLLKVTTLCDWGLDPGPLDLKFVTQLLGHQALLIAIHFYC